jgi:hypothetical protein
LRINAAIAQIFAWWFRYYKVQYHAP